MLRFLPRPEAKNKHIPDVISFNSFNSFIVSFNQSLFASFKELFNFSKMICKKLLDFIEYENELCALN